LNNKNNNILQEPDFSWLFKNKARPSNIKEGQLWTIFGPVREKNLSDPGQIVLIMETNENFVFVIPVHATESTRTILDPVIFEEMHTAFPSPLVAVVHMAITIGKEPFETAKYIGEIKPEGMEIIKNQYEKYLKAIDALAYVQIKDAHNEELTDEEEATATKAGIYKLCPVNGDIDSLIEFNNEISDILQPWHVLAMAEMFAEEEVKQIDEVAEKRSKYGKSIPEKIIEIITELIPEPVLDFGFRGSETRKMSFKITVSGVKKSIDLIIMIEKDENRIIRAIQSDVDKIEMDCSGRRIQFKKIGSKWVPEKEVVIKNTILMMVEKEGKKFEFEIDLKGKE